jgi:hypothetical protein
MHQTPFGVTGSWNGATATGAWRRRLRRVSTSPWRFSASPIVLGDGKLWSGNRSCSQARSFLGPQRGWSFRAATSVASISTVIAFGFESGLLERFSRTRTSRPASRYLFNHVYPVGRLMPYARQSSLRLTVPQCFSNNRSHSSTNFVLSFTASVLLQGMRPRCKACRWARCRMRKGSRRAVP